MSRAVEGSNLTMGETGDDESAVRRCLKTRVVKSEADCSEIR